MNKEYRSGIFEVAKDDEGLVVEGYAAVKESITTLYEIDGVEYKEIIDSRAFDNCDMTDVPFKYNHSDDFLVLARTRNKTLELTVDERGLKVRAKLADVNAGRDLYALIQRGDIDKMSFAFTVTKDSYDSLTRTRRILEISKIYDVSAVDTPAYQNTNIAVSARDYFAAKAEIENAEKRKRLALLTMI